MTTVIQENIAGVRVVKAFSKEAAQIEKFRGRKELFLATLLDTVNYWAARVPFAQFIFGLGLPLTLWVGGRQVIRGDLDIGDLAKAVREFRLCEIRDPCRTRSTRGPCRG